MGPLDPDRFIDSKGFIRLLPWSSVCVCVCVCVCVFRAGVYNPEKPNQESSKHA